MICKKCCLPIDSYTDLSTVCEGQCAGVFHAACVGLTEAQLDTLNNNIIWFCDECAMFYRNMRDGSPAKTVTNVDQELTAIRLQIMGIQNTLSLIVPPAQPAANLHSTPLSSPSQVDRTRQNSDVEVNRVNKATNTSISNSSLLATSLSAVEPILPLSSTGTENSSSQPVEAFALFLSNINSIVTEQQVSDLVSRSLDSKLPFKVKKLVPA